MTADISGVPGDSSPGTPSTLAKPTTEIPVSVTINEVLVRDIRFILRTDAGDGLERAAQSHSGACA